MLMTALPVLPWALLTVLVVPLLALVVMVGRRGGHVVTRHVGSIGNPLATLAYKFRTNMATNAIARKSTMLISLRRVRVKARARVETPMRHRFSPELVIGAVATVPVGLFVAPTTEQLTRGSRTWSSKNTRQNRSWV